MKYQQITREERYTIAAYRAQGLSVSHIAELTGRHRSTLYREFQRNSCHRTDGGYRPSKADSRTRGRRRRSRRNRHYSERHFKLVRALLRKKYSPEQIVGYIRRHKLMKRRLSHETIYQYIWRNKKNGGNLWTHLRQASKQRRKRYKAYDSRGRLADKRHITDRPKSVEGRRYKGHWEIDTVHGRGSNHCIVTLLERKTGFVMIGKLKNKSTYELNKKTVRLINRDPRNIKTITADNGTEFHQYKKIEDCCAVKFYFATPYHSWERGSNEHVNGLIRQYLPKNQSMEDITQQQCDAIAMKLNSRPRKRFGYKTPEEMYYGR
ncbi:IS30 family transposase [Microbulbifer elongatus]|uniref:IS30 family transposase n=2 Tax=Microbulbifer TaxID=48073 RepID=A0ABT1P4Z3_9GAMM|nr:IS30 family transposase [Microbulbifer elongatus]MCQ3831160.1 IS30 family transposase [Microbulbifer elongatus]